MNTIIDSLTRLSTQALGTVVHLGAGRGDQLAGYAALAPHRLVLVEGDPETFAELQAGAHAMPGAVLRREVVASQGGQVSWHRFNLRHLNGPFEPAALRRYYPRLASLGTQPVVAVGVAELLAPLVPTKADEQPAVLVLDLPGQEAALLAALPAETLRAFQWMVVRSCSEPQGAADAAALARLLGSRCFRALRGDTESEPLWPLTVWQFDEARFESERLREHCRVLEADLSAREALLRTASDAQQRAQGQADEALQRLAALQSELAEATRRQADASIAGEEQARRAAEREAQLKAALADMQALTQDRGKLAAEHEALGRANAELKSSREDQVRLAAERETQLKAALADKQALTQDKVRLVAERDLAVKDKADALALRDTLAKERTSLTAARDEQAKLAAERGKRISTLEAELIDLRARQEMLQEELIKAEAQIELIKDLLMREPAL